MAERLGGGCAQILNLVSHREVTVSKTTPEVYPDDENGPERSAEGCFRQDKA